MPVRVYITQPVHASAIERLQRVAEVEWNRDALHILSKAELMDAARRCDILYCLLHDQVDRDVLEANPKLRAVASTTITPADIDIASATARGIPVTVIPALLLNDATADLTWALLLCVARRVAEGDRLMRTGTFPGSQSAYMEGGAVSGKTLGLIGMGGVGRAVARRAFGFSMRLLYHDPRRLDSAEERALGLSWVTLEELLSESDFVSLHARLTSETRHMMGDGEFDLMKRSAYFINTARGALVDEQALVRALSEGRIAGAALDVFEHEPRPHPELLKRQNVVMTPHVGSAVTELRAAMANVAVDNILAIVEGRQPPNCWNPEVYRPGRSIDQP
ncbi:MAG: glyoxylate reductase [Betaproteobacteria bacterium]